ncbi:hypothetical protein N7456_010614 [Penicillium angulare]|uniref:Uncharacterized protein n=1 Tax=Penicillium angulare TaxID=116970 RepID=A0A9W9K6B5_9EURO|nr:hypothetical protein N7456_010614 [Penicillium angulare]
MDMENFSLGRRLGDLISSRKQHGTNIADYPTDGVATPGGQLFVTRGHFVSSAMQPPTFRTFFLLPGYEVSNQI